MKSTKSYIIVRINRQDFYISIYQNSYLQYQKILVSGEVESIVGNGNYYSFDFMGYLKNNNVNYQIKKPNIRILPTTGMRYLFWKWINGIDVNDSIKLFLLNDKSKDILINQELNNLGIGFLTNFNGLSFYVSLSVVLYPIKKYQRRRKAESVILAILWFWIYLLNYPNVFLRVLIFKTLNNILNYSKFNLNQIFKRMTVVYLVLMIDPWYLLNQGFWYVSIAYLYLWINNKKKGIKGFVKQLITLSVVFLPLQIYFTYRLNLFNQLNIFLIYPLIELNSLLVKLTWFIPGIQSVYTLLDYVTYNVLIIMNKISFFINIGSLPSFVFVLHYLILFKVINLRYQKHKIIILEYVMLFLLILIWWILKPNIRLDMLNVGNGNAFVISFKWRFQTFLFDAGVGSGFSKSTVADFLIYQGINKVDAIFVSHNHQDHYNGIEKIDEVIKIKQIITREFDTYHFSFNSIDIFKFDNPYAISENDLSSVYIVDINDTRVVFTGDIEKQTENYFINNQEFINKLKERRVDILQVPHHGSKTSSSPEFISLINPVYALISGHSKGRLQFPNIETINTLNSFKIPYFITAGNYNWGFNLSNLNFLEW
ncbi:MBL fold metallo-hydrolase [[Acholeplasma] multilocale]|uniref:MBL fold metallo-hydrolase n=1 Tax=[Acholeplasma] multilocale TaxID=264638 RepID=UPI00244E1CE2|nr:MBL fold metallo-hydrolase [[Acholeplasma] multilocale]